MTDSDNKATLGTPDNPLDDEENKVVKRVFDGRFLTENYLSEELIFLSNKETHYSIEDDKVEQIYNEVRSIFDAKLDENMNETNAAEFIIFPILKFLGWEKYTREYRIPYGSGKFASSVDALLFLDDEEKEDGAVLLENKRPSVLLDDKYDNLSAPAIQILGYLRHASIVSDGKIKWGILTNGKEWRLYYQNAQSVSEEFFSVHLDSLFRLEKKEEALACFKIFLLMFAKQSFIATGIENKSFHLLALEGVRLNQQQITDDMAERIFTKTYGDLAKAIAAKATDASSEEIRISALKFLFRVLFIMFAEDRGLLPVDEEDYKKVSLRHTIRTGIHKNISVSTNTYKYWGAIKDLFRIINNGDDNYKIPKYNGGLFKDEIAPLEGNTAINDEELVEIIRHLSHVGKAYINYKSLNVEQLGAIYEQLLEREIVKQEGKSEIVVSNYTRKKSGSYYTPQELVNLVIAETIEPLYKEHMDAFDVLATEIMEKEDKDSVIKKLTEIDPAKMILSQKICDPAMGSGHFLVSLTDRLTDQVISAMGQAEEFAEEFKYKSPVRQDIEKIKKTIRDNAKSKYPINEAHLKDRHVVKRMVLKKCIYGVDKNPMATELAKLALWLHTFTVGAPLSFLDHHLKCGDSLFGLRDTDLEKHTRKAFFIWDKIRELNDETSKSMIDISNLTDAEISQVEKSEEIYIEAQEKIEPMRNLLSFLHASDWLKDSEKKKKKRATQQEVILLELMDGQYGDPVEVLENPEIVSEINYQRDAILDFINDAKKIAGEENFFHWQIEFPEVWTIKNGKAEGGFDAIVGNPPWERVKLQEVEWFASRDFSVASETTQAKRKKGIKKLKTTNPILHKEYEGAKWRSKTSLDVLRKSGIYKVLNKGDINTYRIFLERSRQIVSETGYVSLIIPSGIATDQQSSSFFKELVKNKEFVSFYDFNNSYSYYNREKSKNERKYFFKGVGGSVRFCIFTSAKFPNKGNISYGCLLQGIADINNSKRCFPMTAEDFNLVNPDTGTAPMFINEKDKDLIISIYKEHLVLQSSVSINYKSKWNVHHLRMLDATNDSNLFKDKKELKDIKAYPKDNRYKNKDGVYLPLYKGKMVNLHDHRANSIVLNSENVLNPYVKEETTIEQYKDPNYTPNSIHWVLESIVDERATDITQDWSVVYRNVARATDSRTFITSILPKVACDNSLITIVNKGKDKSETEDINKKQYLLYANFSSIIFDFIVRNKIQGPNLNWFIVQQLPVIDVDVYDEKKFGKKTAEEVIREIILELNYTAYDLKAFAKDLGYEGEPFAWNENRRLSLMAKLDAIYFILYGITDEKDIKYIYETFPIIEKRQKAAHNGEYRTCKLCIDYKNALLNGEVDIVY